MNPNVSVHPCPEAGKIVAMAIFKDRCIIACEYMLYEVVDMGSERILVPIMFQVEGE